jgi:putative oxygen-independent coproporphyrinogen III oxidase
MFRFISPPPLSLYIHLPWCVQKCPYCDFNSHALRDDLPERAYVDALLRDLKRDAARVGQRPVQSIFFGGGTPSLFSPQAIDAVLKGVRERVNLSPEAEITLEANPGTVEQSRFEGFRAAGINRLSLGIQSFEPAQLKKLGRIHGREEALRAAAAARAAGIDNFNLDLMYGLPGQDLAGALADLEQAIVLQPTHLSHYQLTLEPNTLFHARPPKLPEDDSIYEMQLAAQALLRERGYHQYETSAYARPGYECRHNLNYWRFGDYLAIGAGAHGKLTDVGAGQIDRYWNRKHPREYLQHAGTAAGLGGEQTLNPPDVVLEFMMNALRLNAGFSIEQCEAHTGLPWRAFEGLVERARLRGWLARDGERIQPTAQGRLYLNELLEIFLPEMP